MNTINKEKPLAIVAGAGQGLGHALLKRFEDGGFKAIGLTRSLPKNDSVFDLTQVDLSDANDVKSKIDNIIQQYGAPKIVVHNPAELLIKPFLETSATEYESVWRSTALSMINLAHSVIEPMVENDGGSFIVSGATASLRGGANFSAFSSAKFALRALTQSLAREYQQKGIHVAHIILDGIIDTARSRDLHAMDPSKMINPEDIAECYWNIAHQARSTWSHEIDLRPAIETF